MRQMKRQPSAALLALLLGTTAMGAQTWLHAPAVDAYAKHDPSGTTILPNGRYIRPEGRSFPLARFPHGLAMSRDGKQLFVPSDGVGQIVTDWQAGAPKILQVNPPRPPGKKKGHLNAGGADFSPMGRSFTGVAGIPAQSSSSQPARLAYWLRFRSMSKSRGGSLKTVMPPT